jgi:hypothetical protein
VLLVYPFSCNKLKSFDVHQMSNAVKYEPLYFFFVNAKTFIRFYLSHVSHMYKLSYAYILFVGLDKYKFPMNTRFLTEENKNIPLLNSLITMIRYIFCNFFHQIYF